MPLIATRSNAGAFGLGWSAGAAFSPLDLSPSLWLDASDTSTITESGGAVSQWDDKSGNNNHASQATAAYQPSTGVHTQNGLNVITFDGANDRLRTAATDVVNSSDGTYTVFAVALNDTLSGTDMILSQDPGGASNRMPQFIRTVGTTPETIAHNTVPTAFTDSAAAVTTGNYFYYSVVCTTTSLEIFRNGVGDGSVAITGTLGTATIAIDVGDRNNSTDFWDGRIAEIIIYDYAMTTNQRQRLESFLVAKWNL